MHAVASPGLVIRARRRLRAETSDFLDAVAPLGASIPADKPSVYYGRRQPARVDDASRGGFVKLQHLQRVFPNAPRECNLLYLVSSALPSRPNLLAQLARLRGMGLIWNQNGVAYPGWHGPGWEQVNRRMTDLMRQARHVFYQSTFCRQASDLFLEPRREAAEVLPNPVDTAQFVPLRLPIRPETLVILAGGTCYQRYRFDVAAQTLRFLLDARIKARLLFAGKPAWSTRALDEATHTIEKLGVSDCLEFVPAYTQREAAGVIGAAHLLLHTKYNDNCPTLVLEALACGLPVVYSSSGGTPELVGPDAGIGIPAPLDWEQQHPPDPGALADAIQRILREYPERSLAARRRAVENFDVVPWLERHRQVFEKILEGL